MKRTPFLFAAGTPMAERHRSYPWETTPLGHPESWDTALKTLVPIMLASNQPMFVAWGASRTLLYNDAYAEILADKHPAALGKNFLDVWQEIRETLIPIVTAALRGEPVQMDHIALWMERRGYREEAHFSFFYSPVRDASGEIGGFFCACSEITAQIMAERRLAESESRHRGVLENMEEGFVMFDRSFTILEVNEAALRLSGLPREELIGGNHWTLFPGAYDAPVGRMYRQALSERRSYLLEHLYRFSDGRERWFEVRAFPVEEGLAVLFQDVTERKKLVEEHSRSFERVQLALDAGAIIGTWVWDIPDNRLMADERFALSFGLDPARLKTGAPLDYAIDAIHPDDRLLVQQAVTRCIEEQGRYRCQYRVFRDGAYRWVEASGRVEVDAQGVASRFPGVLLDIEERRRVEAERDRVAALLETFIDAVPGAVFAKDRQGRYLVANQGAAAALGRPVKEIIGRTDAELLVDGHQAALLMARDRHIMDSGSAQQAEQWLTRGDRSPSFWWSTNEPLRDEAGHVVGLVGTSVDITERKSMEDALRLSEQRSTLAIEVAQLGTWQWDIKTGVVTADLRCRQMCGLDLTRTSFALTEMQERVHPEDWPRVEKALFGSIEPEGHGRYAEEFRWVHPDGRIVWTLSHGIVEFEVGAGQRSPVAMIGSVTDVTERRQMIEALRQADRRKDEFLAMLAHELRNPLAPISTASHVIKLSASDPQRVLDASDIIRRQVGHLTRLVDDLLDVSRVTRGLVELDIVPVDLRTVVSTAVEQVKPLMQSRRHELRTRVGAGPFTVMGDFHRLVQVVSNVLNNAAKYTPQGGVIEVDLGIDRDQAVVNVTDNGVGIPSHMINHVFELFAQAERTPDRSQGGLGIGLALVRSLVLLHGGEVEAHSAGPHRGSTFRIALPLSAETYRGAPEQVATGPTAAGGRILIVDDNVDAALTLADVLELIGHTVATAHDATGALDQVTREASWDAFILDIGLPDMTGYELARRLRESPAARDATFIALTGYGQPQDRVISRTSGFDHHLVKPAEITQIMEILSNRVGKPLRS